MRVCSVCGARGLESETLCASCAAVVAESAADAAPRPPEPAEPEPEDAIDIRVYLVLRPATLFGIYVGAHPRAWERLVTLVGGFPRRGVYLRRFPSRSAAREAAPRVCPRDLRAQVPLDDPPEFRI